MKRCLPLLALLLMGSFALAQCPLSSPLSTPYYENFDTIATGVTDSNFTNCWVSTTASDPNWESKSGSTISSGTGPNDDYTGGGVYVYMETSSGSLGDTSGFISPQIDLSGLSNPELVFYYHMFGGDMGDLEVRIWNGSSWTSELLISGQQHSATSDPWTYANVDLSAYTGTIQLMFLGTRGGGYEGDMAIDEVSVANAPACPFPLDLQVSNITNSSAEVSFNDRGETSFEYMVGPSGFNQATMTASSTTSNPIQVSGLVGDNTYDLYLRNDCSAGGNGASVWVGPVTFTTDCDAFSTFTTGFENEALDAVPHCWDFYETYSASWVEVEDYGTPFAGSQALVMYNSFASAANDTLMAITPALSGITAGDKQLRFQLQTSDVSSGLIVGTLPSQDGLATFSAIDTLYPSASGTYEEFVVKLDAANGYNGSDEYIVLAHSMGTSYDYIHIDAFNYEIQPQCTAMLLNDIDVAAVTDDSVFFNWIPGQGAKFEVEIGAVGFTPGSGSMTVTTQDTFAGVNGLTPNTRYEAYFRDSCTDGTYSPYVGPVSFYTNCAVPSPTTLPFSEDFETYSGSAARDSNVCQSNYNLSYIQPDGAGLLRFFADTGFANSGFYGLTLDDGGASGTTTNYLVFTFNLSAYASSSNEIALGFAHLQHGEEAHANDKIWVRGSVNDPWVELYDLYANQGPDGQYVIEDNILLRAPLMAAGQSLSATTQIRFGQEDNSEATSLTGVDGRTFDDITLEEVSCANPSVLSVANVVDTAATLGWNSFAGAANYEVWVGPAGFWQGSQTTGGVMGTVNTTSLTVDTLAPNSCFEFVVRSTCGAADTSVWSAPYSFCTPCSEIQAPYYEGFDSSTVVPDCWAEVGQATSDIYFTSFIDHGATVPSPPNAVEFNDAESAYLISPSLKGLGSGQYMIEASIAFEGAGEGFPDTLLIGTLPNQMDTGSFAPYDTIVLEATDGSFQEMRFFMDNTSLIGSNSYVAFTYRNSGGNWEYYLDDFRYRLIPTCPEPYAYFADTATATTADLRWTGNGSGSWELSYGPKGFTAGTAGSMVVSNDTVTLSGLSSNTHYDVYVREICGAGDTSIWEGPVSFQTLCSRADKLAGVYTIDPSQPTGGANYGSFVEAANDINYCGIKGDVTFNVAAGTYNERLVLNKVIGSAVDSAITFDGGSAASVVIRDSSNTDTATIYLNGASYITLKNMTIENYSDGDAWGVMLQDSASFNTVDSCIINMPVTTTTDVIGIVASASLSFETSTGSNAHFFTVSNSQFIGGETGIHLTGGSANADYNTNNSVINNSFLLQDDHAIEVDGQVNVVIKGNQVDSLVSTFADAIYVTDVDDFEISENMVNSPDYGIYVLDGNDGNSTTLRSEVINNMVISTSDYGIYLNDVEKVDVFHNTVVGEPALIINDQVDHDIRNNILVSNSDFAFESFDALTSGDIIDYNLYFSGGANVADDGTSSYADLLAWQTADNTRNSNSVEGDPLFVSAIDLHVVGALANDAGDNSVNVAMDIDGDVRPASGSTTVDIGADEFTPLLNDVAVVDIISPEALDCGDSNNTVIAVIQNYGLQTQTGFNVYADVSGAAMANLSMTYGGSLSAAGIDTVTIGTFNGVAGGMVTVTAYTGLISDQDNSNDTTSINSDLATGMAPMPTAAMDSVCAGNYDTLYYPAGESGVFYWLTANSDTIAANDSLVVGPLGANDTTFQLMAQGDQLYSLGAVDNSIGSGGNYTTMTNGLEFTATQAFTLDSVSVYPNGAGDVVVNIEDAATGTVVHTDTVAVPASAAGVKTAIALGFNVAPGSYEITAEGSTTGGLYRNSSGASYPYSVAGVVDITDANNGLSNYYYFFYDWKISVPSCPRPVGSITLYNKGAMVPAFSSNAGAATATDLTVTFDASATTGASSYNWNFGDGNTGTGVNTQHSYTQNGTYNVVLTVSGDCGVDSVMNTVVVQGIGLEESALGRSLSVYPNPSEGVVNLSFTSQDADAVVIVTSLNGEQLRHRSLSNINGSFEGSLDLSALPAGVYMLKVQSGDELAVRRLIIQ